MHAASAPKGFQANTGGARSPAQRTWPRSTKGAQRPTVFSPPSEMSRLRSLGHQRGRQVGNRTAGRFFAVLRECIEIDLRRMVIAAAGGLQRRGSVGSIRTVLAVMTAYVRGTGLHRDALARKRHIRGSARRQQVDGKQQQRYESFQFHAIILGSGYSSTPHSASFPAHACASRRAVASSTS